jgi:hypothetical protein
MEQIPSIVYVAQREDTDCVIACLAMVTGQTYDEVMHDMIPFWDLYRERGVSDRMFYEYLGEKNYCVSNITKFYSPQQIERTPWPVAPFAPVHVVGTMDEGYYHSVVMDWRGIIHDPSDMSAVGLHEYEEVYEIVGIWPKPKR